MAKTVFELRGASYELEIPIDAPREQVWKTMTGDIGGWWLPDFHMVGAGSVVELRAEAGGQLIERLEGGGSLLWATVQMVTPGASLALSGFSFPAWGGPGLTLLTWSIDERDGGCTVRVSDSHVGRVSDEHIASLQEGWTQLFTDGLKKYVETGSI